MGTETLPFGHALEVLKNEEAGKWFMQGDFLGGARIFIQKPDKDSKMTEPYFYMETKTSDNSFRRCPIEFSSDLLLQSNWKVTEVAE